MRILVLASICSLLSTPTLAAAEDATVALRLGGGAAFGGSIDTTVSSDAYGGDESYSETETDDLGVNYGGGVQVDMAVIEGLRLGVGMHITSWGSRRNDDLDKERNRFLDFDLVVRWSYPLDEHFSTYVQVPFGIAVSAYSNSVQESFGARLGHGYGVHLAGAIGAEYLVDGRGVFLEAGAVYRWVRHETSGTILGTPTAIDLDGAMAQFQLSGGFVFGF